MYKSTISLNSVGLYYLLYIQQNKAIVGSNLYMEVSIRVDIPCKMPCYKMTQQIYVSDMHNLHHMHL